MNAKKTAGAFLALIIAAGTFAFSPAAEITGTDTAVSVSARKSDKDFIIEKDGEGDSYIAGYKGKGGKITIPEGVSYIDYDAFKGNNDITSVTFPEGTTDYGIYGSAFEGCLNLQSVNIKGNCAIIGENAFKDCISLKTVKIGGNIEYYGEGGILSGAFKNCRKLEKLDFSKEYAAIDIIGNEAFMNCFVLYNLTLPSGVKAIGDDAFTNCANLGSVIIPAGVSSIGKYAFGYMLGYRDEETAKAAIAGKSDKKPVRLRANAALTKEYEPNTKFVYAETVSAGKENKAEPSYSMVRQLEMNITAAKDSAAEKWAEKYKIKYISKEYGENGKLSAPTGLKASKSTSKIVLKWNAVEGADGYRVYKYDPKTKKYVKYKSVTKNTCTVSKLESGTEYSFKVAALEKKGEKYEMGKMSEKIKVTTKGSAPEKEKTYPALPKLSKKAQKKLCEDFAAIQGGDASNKYIHAYFGTYNGCEAVVMWDKTMPATMDMRYAVLGEYTIAVGSGCYQLCLHSGSDFIDIEEAYAQGMLTDEDAAAIFYYSTTEEAYSYIPES